MSTPRLLLASSSTYRHELLARLRLPFDWASPNIDESALPGETPCQQAGRLARLKAEALAGQHPARLIIGSDQVTALGNQVFGKPMDFEQAREQLRAASGHTVHFLTGLALLNTASGQLQQDVVSFQVHFRSLTDASICRYLESEQPYDCAGSFRAEGLGISLFRAMEGTDFTSLIGLPLVRLVDMLHHEGISLP